MWLTSKMPTPVRTAMCSAMIPPPIDAGYSTGMSQPLNSTIFAPIWRWTAFSAVLRMVVADAGRRLYRRQNKPQSASSGWTAGIGVTDYRITRFFGGSNRKNFQRRGHGGRRGTPEENGSPPGVGNIKSIHALCVQIYFYRPNCTVTRAPAAHEFRPPESAYWRRRCRRRRAVAPAPAPLRPHYEPSCLRNDGTTIPPCSTSSTTVPLVGSLAGAA